MPEAIRLRLAETLPHLSLHNAYGATETTSPATLVPLGFRLSQTVLAALFPAASCALSTMPVAM